MASIYHPILAQQLEQCFTFEQLCDLAQDSVYGHSFTVFLSHVSRTYASVDQQYQVAKAIAKSARHSEERLTRFENIVHYAKDILTIIRAEDGVASYSSPAVKSDLGFEPQLFMCGEKFDRELVHPDDIPLLQNVRKSLSETREPQLVHYRVKQLTVHHHQQQHHQHPHHPMHSSSNSNLNALMMSAGGGGDSSNNSRAGSESGRSSSRSTSSSISTLSSASQQLPLPSSHVITSKWVWLESSFRPVRHKNLVVVVSRIIPVDTFMGKLRAGEERLRMTENVLRQVRHYLDDRYGKGGCSPRSSDEWSVWLQRFRRSNSLMAVLESSLHEVIQVLDSSGTFLYVSPACHTLLGYSPEELIGTNNFDTMHPDDQTYVKQCALNMDPRQPQTMVIRRRAKDGSWKWVERSGFIYHDTPSSARRQAWMSPPSSSSAASLSSAATATATSSTGSSSSSSAATTMGASGSSSNLLSPTATSSASTSASALPPLPTPSPRKAPPAHHERAPSGWSQICIERDVTTPRHRLMQHPGVLPRQAIFGPGGTATVNPSSGSAVGGSPSSSVPVQVSVGGMSSGSATTVASGLPQLSAMAFLSVSTRDAKIMYASPEACTLLCVSLADLTARCSIFDLLSSRHFDFLTRVLMLPPNSSLDMEVYLRAPSERSMTWECLIVSEHELLVLMHHSLPTGDPSHHKVQNAWIADTVASALRHEGVAHVSRAAASVSSTSAFSSPQAAASQSSSSSSLLASPSKPLSVALAAAQQQSAMLTGQHPSYNSPRGPPPATSAAASSLPPTSIGSASIGSSSSSTANSGSTASTRMMSPRGASANRLALLQLQQRIEQQQLQDQQQQQQKLMASSASTSLLSNVDGVATPMISTSAGSSAASAASLPSERQTRERSERHRISERNAESSFVSGSSEKPIPTVPRSQSVAPLPQSSELPSAHTSSSTSTSHHTTPHRENSITTPAAGRSVPLPERSISPRLMNSSGAVNSASSSASSTGSSNTPSSKRSGRLSASGGSLTSAPHAQPVSTSSSFSSIGLSSSTNAPAASSNQLPPSSASSTISSRRDKDPLSLSLPLPIKSLIPPTAAVSASLTATTSSPSSIDHHSSTSPSGPSSVTSSPSSLSSGSKHSTSMQSNPRLRSPSPNPATGNSVPLAMHSFASAPASNIPHPSDAKLPISFRERPALSSSSSSGQHSHSSINITLSQGSSFPQPSSHMLHSPTPASRNNSINSGFKSLANSTPSSSSVSPAPGMNRPPSPSPVLLHALSTSSSSPSPVSIGSSTVLLSATNSAYSSSSPSPVPIAANAHLRPHSPSPASLAAAVIASAAAAATSSSSSPSSSSQASAAHPSALLSRASPICTSPSPSRPF